MKKLLVWCAIFALLFSVFAYSDSPSNSGEGGSGHPGVPVDPAKGWPQPEKRFTIPEFNGSDQDAGRKLGEVGAGGGGLGPGPGVTPSVPVRSNITESPPSQESNVSYVPGLYTGGGAPLPPTAGGSSSSGSLPSSSGGGPAAPGVSVPAVAAVPAEAVPPDQAIQPAQVNGSAWAANVKGADVNKSSVLPASPAVNPASQAAASAAAGSVNQSVRQAPAPRSEPALFSGLRRFFRGLFG
ncbi:hypothetical protein HYY74_02305 [Candidatus Woesearchaeota archaeon]|nr:hypothetical protein [Candidatus Woesearchaeota archaeon]